MRAAVGGSVPAIRCTMAAGADVTLKTRRARRPGDSRSSAPGIMRQGTCSKKGARPGVGGLAPGGGARAAFWVRGRGGGRGACAASI